MRQVANRKRRDVEFKPGDLVLVKLQPHRQVSVAGHPPAKLAKCYYGPFPVLEKIGAIAYRIQLPETSRIHPVFHISLLKPFQAIEGGQQIASSQLPANDFLSKPFPKPIAICSDREILQRGVTCKQVLVQWEGTYGEFYLGRLGELAS